jgi:hypothetical protein
MVTGDTLTITSASASFVDKNAGSGKTVNVTGLSLSGTDAGNYTLADNTATTTADIAKASISAITGISASNKTYDGNTTATLDTSSIGFTGMVTGDGLTLASASGSFDDKNVGSGKTVTVSGLSLSGTDAGNYTLADSTVTTTADIAKAVISAISGITASNKTYDGNTTATLDTSSTSFTGLVTGDALTIASASASFDDKNAGSGKTVNVSGLSLSGADAGNYTLAVTTSMTTADIAKAVISAITGITAANKTYDGTTNAALETADAGFTGMVSGDALSLASASGSFANTNAGIDKTVNITGLSIGGADAGNYTLADTASATTADIAKAVISAITGITAANKTYDGSIDATLDATGVSFGGMVSGDALSVASATGSFADKNAGDGKSVSITGLTLGGADASNYTLADTTAIATADITKAVISAITSTTAANKTYDGTTNAALETADAGFTGMISGDALSLATATGNFVDKNPGIDKTVNVNGLSLGGADAGNYTLADTATTSTADIVAINVPSLLPIAYANNLPDELLALASSELFTNGPELIEVISMEVNTEEIHLYGCDSGVERETPCSNVATPR